jgi:hypothetical protein
MPPRKQARQSNKSVQPEGETAQSMSDLHPVNQAVLDWVNEVYVMRSNKEGLVDATKCKPWPVLHGGSFKEIAQRAWSDPGKLLGESLELLKKAGESKPDADLNFLGDNFLKQK